jgi:type VI secretion system protein ImpC
MSYTLCVSKIAHYVKHIIRDKIGSVADPSIIQGIIERWLSKFITTIYGPSQLEIARFPFRSASVEVEPMKGMAGWYHTSINITPHIQFEGMNVTMKVDARLEPSLFGDVDPDED